MKLLVVIVALVVLWLLLRGLVRRNRGEGESARKPPSAAPRAMLACAHCGMHMPQDEALPGRGGVFCGEAHRAAYEQQHPNP
jgi:uncharacterized protein